MYVARTDIGAPLTFMLRETYRSGDVLYSRDLAELGRDPGRMFVYDDDSSFRLSERLVDGLRERGVNFSYTELEDLLFPYLDPYIKQRLAPFRNRFQYRSWHPASEALRRRALEETHVVDRRRIHFLRLGRAATETGTSQRKAAALYTSLLDKSRDEIEQSFQQQEQQLKPRELLSYLFSLFDLQRFFKESYAQTMPQALNHDRLDTIVQEAVCQLSADAAFWRGYPRTGRLQPPLIRYLIMYFDGAPVQSPAWSRYAKSEQTRRFHRGSTGLGSREQVSRIQALAIFGITGADLSDMHRHDLTRLYRKKALELHPDRGGSPELFIKLRAAYEALIFALRH